MVKWCNVRSEKDGLVPVYYTDDAQTALYRTGNVDVTNGQVKWDANGYRLPTEAEWEKAARGGASILRFLWGNTISWSEANYRASPASPGAGGYSYDVNPTSGYHPTYAVNGSPFTSPVGSFAPNGYGLYDMAGNVSEWCWDWFDYFWYNSYPYSDPQGPLMGSERVLRGGEWYYSGFHCRSAARHGYAPTGLGFGGVGFRAVRR